MTLWILLPCGLCCPVLAAQTLRVRHNLLALPGTTISDVKRVLSHPQALAQCDNYLRGHGMTPEVPAAGPAASAEPSA